MARISPAESCRYLFLIASIGRLREILSTGRKVDINATSTPTPRISANWRMPTLRSVSVKPVPPRSELLIAEAPSTVATEASTQLISVMIMLSLKKMPNTSAPLAPTARRIPISRFL